HGVDLCGLCEEKGGQVRDVAGAGRCVGKLTRIGACVIDELLHGVRRHGGMDEQHHGHGGGGGNRRKVLFRIERQLAVQVGAQRNGGGVVQDGVAIRLGARGGLHADGSVGATLVLD